MSSWRRATPLLLLFALAAGWGLHGLTGAGGTGAAETLHARVTRVVDGDTVQVEVAGREDTVRYIGMDTPETKRPGTPIQCFGEAASRENERLVAGREVTLRTDVERRDRYGRLLAYVWRRSDGRFVNAELVRGGFARTLTIPPNVAHETDLARLAHAARAAGRGLWRACG